MLKKLLLFIIIPLMLCSCTKDTRENISFATWGSATEVKIIKHLINEFESKNPAIKVNLMHIPQNYFQKIHLLFASNTPADVIFINNLYLPIYGAYLEDLSEYVNPTEYYPQTLDSMRYDSRLAAIPRDVSNLVLYVNLNKAALPDENWKLQELLNLCSKVKAGDFCISYEDKIIYLMPYLAYYGGSVLDKNGNLSINTEKSLKGIEFYKSLRDKYHYAPSKSQVGSSTLAQMFIEGKLAFYLSGRWMYPKISETAKFNWVIINFPYGESPQYVDASGWAIAKGSKHKESAIKFIKFISSAESSKYFAQTGLIVPARIDAAQILNNKKHNEHIFLDVIKFSTPTPSSKNYKKITDDLEKQLDL